MDLSLKENILFLLKIAKEKNLIRDIKREIYYQNDEPKFPSFIVETSNKSFTYFGDKLRRYTSFKTEDCLIKMLGEIVERYCLSNYNKEDLIFESYNHLKKEMNVINPKEFPSFSKFYITPEFNLYNSENQKLNWTKAICLNTKKEIFVPAQSIYLTYKFKKNESVINFPISTGGALYPSFKDAFLKGLLEVIERDAFMISYLNKLPRNIIDIRQSKDADFQKIIYQIDRYNLDLLVLDISNDVPVYSILVLLLDKTNIGPAISVGTCADFNLKNAILGAAEECFQVRPWIKVTKIIKGIEAIKKLQKKVIEGKLYLYGQREKMMRGLLYSTPEILNKIDFFFKGGKIAIKNLPLYKFKKGDNLINWFIKQKIEIIYKNLTPVSLQNKFFVVKVIIPSFQPLYFDERFPVWNEKRLKKVSIKMGFKPAKNINTFPHPFL